MGASAAQIERVAAKLGGVAQATTSEDVEVPDDIWESWKVFLSVQTQWSWVSGGLGAARRVALDYTRVESGLRLQGLPRGRWPQVFEDLREIEQAVLSADHERATRPKGA